MCAHRVCQPCASTVPQAFGKNSDDSEEQAAVLRAAHIEGCKRLGEPSTMSTKDESKGVDVGATQWSHSGGYVMHFENRSARHVFNTTLSWTLTNSWLLTPDSGDAVAFSLEPGSSRVVRCQPIAVGEATAYNFE